MLSIVIPNYFPVLVLKNYIMNKVESDLHSLSFLIVSNNNGSCKTAI